MEDNVANKTRGEANAVDVIGSATRSALADWHALALAFLFLTVPPVWADIYLPEDDATRFSAFMGLASLIPQILLTERALWRRGLIESAPQKGRSYFPRAFGQSLIAGVCIGIGLIAAVIPGLFLIGRWSISLPVLIAQNEGVMDSLGTSWRWTVDRFWLCLSSILLVWTPTAAFTVMLIWFGGLSPLVETIFFEALISITMLLSWFVSVALYGEILRRKVDLTH